MKRIARRWGYGAVCVALMVLVWGGNPWASGSEIWSHRTRAEREEGDLKGVALLEDGDLTLGPAFSSLGQIADPYVWSLAGDLLGNLYVGTGDEGRVYRLDPGGNLELFFDAGELAVHAMVTDEKGQVYVGTSPDGKIYRISPAGEVGEFSTLEATYIWSLVFDEKGDLFAATGKNGSIFKIGPSGSAQVWADTDEIHVRTMIRHPEGGLLAGTDGTGLLIHVDERGEVEVLARSPLAEITSLAADSQGRIFFSSAGRLDHGSRGRAVSSSEGAPSTPARNAEGDEVPPGQPPSREPSPPPSRPPAPPSRPSGPPVQGRVMVLEPGGGLRELWSGQDELILSVALDGKGDLIAGSGSGGKIYRFREETGDATLVNRADSDQVTVLLPGPQGEIWVGGSNLGGIYRLGPELATRGTFRSAPHDAKVTSIWGKIAWRASTAKKTQVSLRVRTGGTPEPDDTWSGWSPWYDGAGGSTITAPPARYLQWEAILTRTGKGVPRLGEVRISFRQRNLPPGISVVSVREPEVVFQAPPSDRKTGGSQGRTGRPEAAGRTRHPSQSPSTQNGKNGAAVKWEATDPNGDQLLYTVYYRGVDEREWKIMKQDLTETFLSWDATAMADGTYLLRVVADDSASNSEETALSSARLSDPFDIDNNPPRFESIEATPVGSSARIQLRVSDSFSPVVEVEYSINAGVWRVIHPADGVADSQSESYEIFLEDLSPGEYAVVFKAWDAMGNSSTAKAVFNIHSSS